MSPIGRLFVFFNLALSAAFLGWAASNLASAQKYRTMFDSVTAELAETTTALEAQISEVTADRDEASRQRSDMRGVKDAAEVKASSLEQDLAKSEDELSKLKADMGNIASTLGDLNQNLGDMKTQVEASHAAETAAIAASRDAADARDQANQARATAVDKGNGLVKELAERERELKTANDLTQEQATTIAMMIEMTGVDPATLGVAVPLIDGAVLQYYSELKLVHINRGSEDQVRRGFVFDIYSSGQYKGQARVEVVNPGSCTAVLLNNVDGTEISQGDRVSTQI